MPKFYIYGLIRNKTAGLLVTSGFGEKETMTVDCEDIAALVSLYEGEISLSRENLLMHMKVLDEAVAKGLDVLPFKFGTLSENEEEIRNLLKDRYSDWLKKLDRISGKVELTVQIFWLDFDQRLIKLVEEDKTVAGLRERLLSQQSYRLLVTTGEVFKSILETRKKGETEEVFKKLISLSSEYKENPYLADANIANWSFLVERSKEKDFDSAVKQAAEENKELYLFKYFGPSAPFDFI